MEQYHQDSYSKEQQAFGVREVVGIFFDADSVINAANDLKKAGFSEHNIGLLAAKESVRERLGHLYDEVGEGSEGDKDEPKTAFVRKESDDPHTHAFIGSLSFVGAAALGGTLVASTALLGSPLLVGLASVAFGGGMAGAMSQVLKKSDADFLKEQLEEGHILLFTRVKNTSEEQTALGILSNHHAFSGRGLTIDENTVKKGYPT